MNPKRQEKRSVLAPKSSRFDLSHAHKTTLDFFRLQPIFCKDMVEGDQFSVNVRSFLEAAPLATKVYGAAHLDLHAFFVPNRLLWDDWMGYFYGNERNTSQRYTIPQIVANSIYLRFGESSTQFPEDSFKQEARRVFSGMGYPMYCEKQNNDSFRLSALPARAYQKIWWDYYRDSVNIPESDIAAYLNTNYNLYTYQDISILMRPRYRSYHKDFISTLLATPQMGDMSSAKVSFSSDPTSVGYLAEQFNTYNQSEVLEGGFPILRTVSAAALRATMATQRYLERLNVTGTRPLERIFALFGVRTDKTRLQMSEFIGAKTIVVNVDGLTNTSSGVGIDDVGQNAFGISATSVGETIGMGYQQGTSRAFGESDSFHYTATEHGYFIIIASLIPDFINVNSVDRMFYRGISTPNRDRFDFYTPDYEGLGYQEVLASEVYFPSHQSIDENPAWKSTADGGEYDPYAVVGYTPKYEDYRYQGDRLSGDFMSLNSRNSMPQLVYTRDFAQMLDPSEFVAGLKLTTATFADRAAFDKHFVISDSDYDHFIMSNYIVVDAVRPMSGNEMPTELSELANSKLLDIANGGMRV